MSIRDPDRHFVFRIGPFGDEPGRYFMYFLQPGDPSYPGVAAVSDRAALVELIKVFPPETLVVEPELAQAATELGIAVAPFDDYASHALGLIALEMHKSTPVRAVEREWVVFALLQSARLLENRSAAAGVAGRRHFVLDFVGDLRFRSFATVRLSDGLPQSVALFNNREERASADGWSFAPDTPGSGVTCLGIRFLSDDPPVLDALRRAHGLRSIPAPAMVVNGASRPVDDSEVLILAVALDAVSRSFAGGAAVESFLRVEDLSLGARLAPG